MSRGLAFFGSCALVSIALAACGTVTGLSDDYKFDLVDGATSGDGGGGDGGGSSDGAADAADALVPFDAGGTCSSNQSNNFQDFVQGANGSSECKTCIESSACCLPIVACANGGSSCKDRFMCDLDCTNQSGSQRITCLNTTCPNQVQTSAPSWTIVARCVTQDCGSKCGQW